MQPSLTLNRFGCDAHDALSALAAGVPGDRWHGAGLSEDSLALIPGCVLGAGNPADGAALLWYVRHRLVFECGLADAPDVLVLSYDAMVREPERSVARSVPSSASTGKRARGRTSTRGRLRAWPA